MDRVYEFASGLSAWVKEGSFNKDVSRSRVILSKKIIFANSIGKNSVKFIYDYTTGLEV